MHPDHHSQGSEHLTRTLQLASPPDFNNNRQHYSSYERVLLALAAIALIWRPAMAPAGGFEPTRSVEMQPADDDVTQDAVSNGNHGNICDHNDTTVTLRKPKRNGSHLSNYTGRGHHSFQHRNVTPSYARSSACKRAQITNRALVLTLSSLLHPTMQGAESTNPHAMKVPNDAAATPTNPTPTCGGPTPANCAANGAPGDDSRPTYAKVLKNGSSAPADLASLIRMVADLTAENRRMRGLLEGKPESSHPNVHDDVPTASLREKRKWLTKPPTFKPGGDISLLDWDTICVNYYTEGGWPSNEWVPLALTSLDASLQRTLHTHMRLNDTRPGNYTWEEFVGLIRQLTGTRDAERTARDEFDAFEWEGGPLDAHTNHRRFEDVLRRCGVMAPDPETVLRKYTHTLPYKLHQRVFPKPGGGRWELTDLIRTVDVLASDERARIGAKMNGKNITDKPSGSGVPPKADKPKKRPFMEKTTDEFKYLMDTKRCLKCGGEGHRKDACPLKGEAADASLRKVLDGAPIKNKAKMGDGFKIKGKKRKGN